MKYLSSGFIFGFALLSAGCFQHDQAKAQPNAEAEEWRLQYTVSGGFAGLDRQLILLSTGELQFKDRKSRSESQRQLDSKQLEDITSKLQQILQQPQETSDALLLGGRCADCFHKELIISRFPQGKRVIDLPADTTKPTQRTEAVRDLQRVLEQLMQPSAPE